MRKLVTVVAGAALLAGACSGGDAPEGERSSASRRAEDGARTVAWPEASFASALEPYDSCDALLGDVQGAALERVGPYGLDGGGLAMTGEGDVVFEAVGAAAEDRAAVPGAPVPTTTAPTSASRDEADGASSQTNVQEVGVDEPDQIKHDGTHLYSVVDGTLRVVDVSGEVPTLTATVPLPAGTGNAQLLLVDDHLLVIESGYGGMVPFADEAMGRAAEAVAGAATTELAVLDVSDPASPSVTQRLSVDGSLLGARMVDGRARLVTSASPATLGFVYPQTSAAEDEAEEANRAIIEGTDIEDWLPTYRVIADDEVVATEPLVECANVSTPGVPSGNGTVSVLTVDVAAGTIDPTDTVSVVADGQTVYASPTTLYVATYEQPSPDVLDDPQQADDEDFASSIHAFDITGDGPAAYVGTGEVQGQLLNQFAMSEHEGVLRVATTVGAPWGGSNGSESWVTTLQRQGGDLVQLGRVGDMGRGERIYSVRFLGDQGYVVTFRQTDPLYALDLADPANPRVTGELKIPGYSSYLHPVGEGRLLGIGQEATDEGRTTGTKVSLFDVSNPAAPAQLHTWTAAGANSMAEGDHHAFLWWPDEDLLVIPLSSYGYDPLTGASTGSFEGAVGLTVTDAGIAERGRIEHLGAGVGYEGCPPGARCAPVPMPVEPECGPAEDCVSTVPTTILDEAICDPAQGCNPGPVPPPVALAVPIARSLVVDGQLLTVSSAGIERSAMADLSELAWLAWP